MLELIIKDKTFEIVENWTEVTLEQYFNFVRIKQIKDIEPLDMSIKFLATLSNNPDEFESYLRKNLSIYELSDLCEDFTWINEDFTEVCSKVESKKILEVEGKKYVIKSNYNKLTLDEMSTYEMLTRDGNLLNDEILFGIILRELDEHGTEKDFTMEMFEDILQLKEKIKMVEIFNYFSFFLRGEKESIQKNTKAYSVRKKN